MKKGFENMGSSLNKGSFLGPQYIARHPCKKGPPKGSYFRELPACKGIARSFQKGLQSGVSRRSQIFWALVKGFS